jgi:hypothetical protein
MWIHFKIMIHLQHDYDSSSFVGQPKTFISSIGVVTCLHVQIKWLHQSILVLDLLDCSINLSVA